jgi:hypothetical protein
MTGALAIGVSFLFLAGALWKFVALCAFEVLPAYNQMAKGAGSMPRCRPGFSTFFGSHLVAAI